MTGKQKLPAGLLTAALLLGGFTQVNAQTKTTTVYVYPAKGQSDAQQQRDEQECHTWAVRESGADPDKVSIQADDDPDVNGGRKIALNTLGGAAVGAGVGVIAGDASKGAAIGAGAGATRGILKRRSAKKRARQENQDNARQQQDAISQNYIKAYSACLEGKGYSVK